MVTGVLLATSMFTTVIYQSILTVFIVQNEGFPESLLVTQSGSPICRVITMFSQLQTDFASLQRLTSTSRDLKLDDEKDRIEKYFEMVERETLNWMNVVLRR